MLVGNRTLITSSLKKRKCSFLIFFECIFLGLRWVEGHCLNEAPVSLFIKTKN